MRILHTSDWHLGQRLVNNDRIAEHQVVLNWLTTTIIEQKADILIVAGDIFDTRTPSNEARALYYSFLTGLQRTACRHIVIVGGNHDSAAMLNAPRDLLRFLNIHIIGCATKNIADEVLILRQADGKPELIVAAVPYLNDGDVRQGVAGETQDERFIRTRQGIVAHFDSAASCIANWQNEDANLRNVPVLATGHLCVSGFKDNKEKASQIYVGSLENIFVENFPPLFQYVALGHIHRAQTFTSATKNVPIVRYSGSIIPLSFSEVRDEKTVTLLECNDNKITISAVIPVPLPRKLRTIRGSWTEVVAKLRAHKATSTDFVSWIEVIVESETVLTNLKTDLETVCTGLPLEIIKFKQVNTNTETAATTDFEASGVTLNDWQPIDVFEQRCAAANITGEALQDLTASFMELLNKEKT